MQNVHDICPRKMTEFPKFLTDTTREYCAYRCSPSVLLLRGCAVRRLYAFSSGPRSLVKDTISEHKQSDIMHVKNSVDHLTMGQVADADCVRETFPLRVATEKSNFRQIGVNETLGGRAGGEREEQRIFSVPKRSRALHVRHTGLSVHKRL